MTDWFEDEDRAQDGLEYAEELRRARLAGLVDEDGNQLFDFEELEETDGNDE